MTTNAHGYLPLRHARSFAVGNYLDACSLPERIFHVDYDFLASNLLRGRRTLPLVQSARL